jgi:hypothetical protein
LLESDQVSRLEAHCVVEQLLVAHNILEASRLVAHCVVARSNPLAQILA